MVHDMEAQDYQTTTPREPTIFIRQPEVLRRTSLSRSSLYELIDAGRFPKPLKLRERINAWPEAEIERWMQAKSAER